MSCVVGVTGLDLRVKRLGFEVCGHAQELGDDDIANVVPETWREGREYFRDRQFYYKVDEIVVAFRSDGWPQHLTHKPIQTSPHTLRACRCRCPSLFLA